MNIDDYRKQLEKEIAEAESKPGAKEYNEFISHCMDCNVCLPPGQYFGTNTNFCQIGDNLHKDYLNIIKSSSAKLP